jgi:hypothetical protein
MKVLLEMYILNLGKVSTIEYIKTKLLHIVQFKKIMLSTSIIQIL